MSGVHIAAFVIAGLCLIVGGSIVYVACASRRKRLPILRKLADGPKSALDLSDEMGTAHTVVFWTLTWAQELRLVENEYPRDQPGVLWRLTERGLGWVSKQEGFTL